MRCYYFLGLFVALSWAVAAQDLYVHTFGKSSDPTLIFLHGGSGYNSASFEETTAQRLAETGFYVVVYDRRGEGRSEVAKAAYTLEQSLADLQQLYRQLKLEKATLLGHSFGGVVGILFAERYPAYVQGLVLLGAPMDFQATFDNIRARCTAIYKAKNDVRNLQYMALLEKMDPHSLPYASYCFTHAMQNGFYNTQQPSKEAIALYARFSTNPMLQQYASSMSTTAPLEFWKNERYTSLNLWSTLERVVQQKIPVWGLYGREDGLFAAAQVQRLQTFLGAEQVLYWENCSHNVFIDQQTLFLQTLQKWLSEHE
jgi:proline iminopeptidase